MKKIIIAIAAIVSLASCHPQKVSVVSVDGSYDFTGYAGKGVSVGDTVRVGFGPSHIMYSKSEFIDSYKIECDAVVVSVW